MTDHSARRRALIDGTVTAAVVACVIGAVWFGARELFFPPSDLTASVPSMSLPKDPVPLLNVPSEGATSAKVGMIVFSDFECPFCGKLARETLPHIRRDFVGTGRATLAFVHFPLAFHKLAMPAAIASSCAHRQGRFWDFHDALFSRNPLTQDGLARAATTLGLDLSALAACESEQVSGQSVEADLGLGADLGVTATPTVLFGMIEGKSLRATDVLVGFHAPTEFVGILDRLIRSGK